MKTLVKENLTFKHLSKILEVRIKDCGVDGRVIKANK